MVNHKLFQLQIKRKKILFMSIQFALVIFLFSMWELLTYLNVLDKFLFSCPSEIIKLLIENIKSSEIFIHIGYSLYHEFLMAKFRLKLKKAGKTTRPFGYGLNQILYDYTVEVRNIF